MTDSRPPSADDLERLLASRYRDTTSEFEARWCDLRRELRQTPVPLRGRFPSLTWPAGLAGVGLVLAAVLLALHPWKSPAPPPAARFSPAFADLAEMDEILGPAAPLLDEDNRVALLHLPVPPPPRT